ncbi:hypothetical protein KAU51_03915 [Candidatus Parcubacteria bacterium]|jgi:hypothetical protein|nr:hypothetical protein [Candidatus Parcubacteria bacterium]
MNEFAVAVALEEGGRVEANIAEIKEILRITMEELGKFADEQILELIERYRI